ncbi:sensor histidine kinase KdpD [Oceanobacillus sp. Castelsardo]|uniref:sensor histidine kinase n=1 Tax=Oceanobacillus sp. Castelsardo TaxID=1851204 RepID=UPI000839231A|nr:HAMP domain-containing sensor histidine kinase [Oceanobacillus sp. Castelsardo]
MKKLRWRLFLHFAAQFISVAVLMVIVILITLFTVIIFVAKDESKHNYYGTLLENITMETGNSIVNLTMNEGWDEGLDDEGVWVQIVDHNGKVIEEGNVPDSLPKQYSSHDLLKMKQTEQLNGYRLELYLETFYQDNYLFVLGYEDQANLVLNHIVQNYNVDGAITKGNIPLVEEKLKEIDGTLFIFNHHDEIKQQLGNNIDINKSEVLDVLVRDTAPDIYDRKVITHYDPDSDVFWALYTPNKEKQDIKLDTYLNVIIAFAITGVIVLLITVVISVWNGFRYGNPLFIFSNWLSRMGNEHYAEVLTERERKQIYRKNGKLKWRYRLYKEVFDAFYEMANRLDKSQKERARLEKTREEWMVGISHDLRTPLTTMEGYGRLLASGEYVWTEDELMDIGKTIHEKSDYMVNLIEDFNLSFKLKNDTGQIVYENMEINFLMQNILRKFHRDMTLRNYSILYRPTKDGHYLPINKRLFERMVDNLIYNSIQHNPNGTEIYVSVNYEGGIVEIIIQDNGLGIDEETRKHLFDRYYRGTNTDERIEGTGLGMSIALQIAKLHDGDIYVKSKENEGTRVILRFQSKLGGPKN